MCSIHIPAARKGFQSCQHLRHLTIQCKCVAVAGYFIQIPGFGTNGAPSISSILLRPFYSGVISCDELCWKCQALCLFVTVIPGTTKHVEIKNMCIHVHVYIILVAPYKEQSSGTCACCSIQITWGRMESCLQPFLYTIWSSGLQDNGKFFRNHI